jgi:hypothetical protein
MPDLYNRHVIRLLLFSAALVLVGCSKNIDTTDAVRQGVMDYGNSTWPKMGLDMNNMVVDVTAVTFEHDAAHAKVSVRPKGTDAAGMELAFDLDRKGDKWVVHGNARSAGATHGVPEGGAPSQGGSELPPGHPGAGAVPDGTQLPPGHPAVGSKP